MAKSLLRTQLTRQIRIFNSNNEQQLQTLQTYRLTNQHLIDSDAKRLNTFSMITLEDNSKKSHLATINYFSRLKSLLNRMLLLKQHPKMSFFWSDVYRRVAVVPQHLNTRTHFHPSILRNFVDFDMSTKIADSDECAYAVPSLDQLNVEIPHMYGYFLNQWQQLGRLPIMALARKAADDIVSHRLFQEIGFQNQDVEAIEKEHPANIALNQLYNNIHLIYEADFANTDYKRGLKSRAQSGIQASYDQLQSRNVCTDEGVMRFRNSLASERTRPTDDTRRTVVGYGDINIRDTYCGNAPIPVKQIQHAIAEKAIVILVDELCTFVTYCHLLSLQSTSRFCSCSHVTVLIYLVELCPPVSIE
ncbi:hypothetical protein BD560DRAFT_489451 [Blakeslea trispora]|nr:hypothetical protein BD560DRAFT_489451 [Blakeslea trispora]